MGLSRLAYHFLSPPPALETLESCRVFLHLGKGCFFSGFNEGFVTSGSLYGSHLKQSDVE